MGVTTTTNLGLNKPDLDEPMPNWPAQNASDCETIDGILVSSSGTYTPVLTSNGTNPTLGNSVIVGKWIKPTPKFIMVWIKLTIGSTFNPGTGAYRWTLPEIPDSINHIGSGTFGGGHIVGKITFRDDSSVSSSLTGVVQLRSIATPDVTALGEQSIFNFGADLSPATDDIFSLSAFYSVG